MSRTEGPMQTEKIDFGRYGKAFQEGSRTAYIRRPHPSLIRSQKF
jgi:hypothetical protein